MQAYPGKNSRFNFDGTEFRLMAPSRLLIATAAVLMIVPAPLSAQEVSSMLARVEADGNPVAGVTFALITGGTRRPLATTGSTGLAVIEFGRVPLDAGARLATLVVTCGERHEVLFTREAGSLPVTGEGCVRTHLGTVVWGRIDRMNITLADTPRLSSRAAAAVVRAGSGFRVQAGPSLSFVGGDELDNLAAGFGGELLLGYDSGSGPGIGLGVALARHGLTGPSQVDEGLWRWAILVEPRYTFSDARSRARPYLAARIARQMLDPDQGSGLTSETGWSFGLGGGLIVPLVLGTSLDVSAHAARMSVGAEFNGVNFDRSGMLYSLGGAIRY